MLEDSGFEDVIIGPPVDTFARFEPPELEWVADTGKRLDCPIR